MGSNEREKHITIQTNQWIWHKSGTNNKVKKKWECKGKYIKYYVQYSWLRYMWNYRVYKGLIEKWLHLFIICANLTISIADNRKEREVYIYGNKSK